MDAASLIRHARTRAGLTQRELAHRSSTSQAMVNRYEQGKVQPALSTLRRLLAACGEALTMSAVPAAPVAPIRALAGRHGDELRAIARRHNASRLRLFGSAARGDAHGASDVDLLVDLEPGSTLVDLAAIRREAAELLGVAVDVATEKTLAPEARESALRDAIPL